MSKRKADGALFEKCQGIKGLADNHLRAVIARLSDRDDAEVHAKKKICQRFSDVLHLLQCSELPRHTGRQMMSVWTTSIAEFCQMRCEKDKVFFESLRDFHGPFAEGICYCDEITPGNPLRPDNARKSLVQPGTQILFYFVLRRGKRSIISNMHGLECKAILHVESSGCHW